MPEFRKLTPSEVFFIFKEEHRLCSPLDPEVDPSFDLQPTSTIAEWMEAIDGRPWMELREVYNDLYNMNVAIEDWRSVAGFSNEKPMQGVFELIAKYGRLDLMEPIKILGQTCIHAAVFKSIMKHLSSKGVDTSKLTPSSPIEPALKNNYGDFIGYINRNFTGVIPGVIKNQTTLSQLVGLVGLASIVLLFLSLFIHILITFSIASFVLAVVLGVLERRRFYSKEGMLIVPGLVTFRDLTNKIVETQFAKNRTLS